jgi:hypothetical protein
MHNLGRKFHVYYISKREKRSGLLLQAVTVILNLMLMQLALKLYSTGTGFGILWTNECVQATLNASGRTFVSKHFWKSHKLLCQRTRWIGERDLILQSHRKKQRPTGTRSLWLAPLHLFIPALPPISHSYCVYAFHRFSLCFPYHSVT